MRRFCCFSFSFLFVFRFCLGLLTFVDANNCHTTNLVWRQLFLLHRAICVRHWTVYNPLSPVSNMSHRRMSSKFVLFSMCSLFSIPLLPGMWWTTSTVSARYVRSLSGRSIDKSAQSSSTFIQIGLCAEWYYFNDYAHCKNTSNAWTSTIGVYQGAQCFHLFQLYSLRPWMLQEISITHMRIVEGIQSELQLCALIARLVAKSLPREHFAHIPNLFQD
jgi:hypothetical protein